MAGTHHIMRYAHDALSRPFFGVYTCIHEKLLQSFLKANMKSYIQLETAAIFFLANLLLARCMLWLISFARANSGCKERKPRIIK